jgi:hypothetical protein
MDWFRAVNSYCERTEPGFWSEPVNALTNAAFLAAAWASWRLARQAGDRMGQVLALILAAVGVGSFLFHTVAQVWALYADVIPIQAFILVYLYAATVRFFDAPRWAGLLAALVFVPASGAAAAAIGTVTGPLNGSVGYLPVPLLILGYAAALRRRAPEAARGLALGAALLGVSLVFRTIDAAACARLPLGTHFAWHLLNAVMLGWMIRVLVKAAPRPYALALKPRLRS